MVSGRVDGPPRGVSVVVVAGALEFVSAVGRFVSMVTLRIRAIISAMGCEGSRIENTWHIISDVVLSLEMYAKSFLSTESEYTNAMFSATTLVKGSFVS